LLEGRNPRLCVLERQKLFRIEGAKGGKGFSVLVYPRKPSEPRPEFVAIAGMSGVKVVLPDQTHWVVASLRPVEFQDGDLHFRGSAGVAKRYADGRMSMTLLAPGRIDYGKTVLDARGPATLEVRD